MEKKVIYTLDDDVKVAFVLAIGEEVFNVIEKSDERYVDGRDALDKCWVWVENKDVSGDELYELIDNVECTGISEFAEEEEDLNIARLWSLLVDIVSYTAWKAYIKEKTKYLPQALEGIEDESLEILVESAIDTTFISIEQIQQMKQYLLYKLQVNNTKIMKNDFMDKISND